MVGREKWREVRENGNKGSEKVREEIRKGKGGDKE